MKNNKFVPKIGLLLTSGVLAVTLTSCSTPETTPAPSTSSSQSSNEPLVTADPADAQAVATRYQDFLNAIYNANAADIIAVVPKTVGDVPTEEEKKAIVEALETNFPQYFEPFYTEGLSYDQKALVYFNVFSLIQQLNTDGFKATLEVPVDAITVTGNTAIADTRKVIVNGSDGTVTADESSKSTAFIKAKNGVWYLTPPEESIQEPQPDETKQK